MKFFHLKYRYQKASGAKSPPPEVKQKRKYVRKMKAEPMISAPEPVETKTEPSPVKQKTESAEIPLDYLLASATKYFGLQAVKSYCNITAFVELATLVHPDDWPKLAYTLRKM